MPRGHCGYNGSKCHYVDLVGNQSRVSLFVVDFKMRANPEKVPADYYELEAPSNNQKTRIIPPKSHKLFIYEVGSFDESQSLLNKTVLVRKISNFICSHKTVHISLSVPMTLWRKNPMEILRYQAGASN
jgi:hypothetical protein